MKKNILRPLPRIVILVALVFLAFWAWQKMGGALKDSDKTQRENSGTIEVEGASFLKQQEELGGHTIARHVEKSDKYLRDRLENSSIRAASTYDDIDQAGEAIVNALHTNHEKIEHWLESKGTGRFTLRYVHGRDLGRVLERSSSHPRYSSKILIVLQRQNAAPLGYFVLTSYPV